MKKIVISMFLSVIFLFFVGTKYSEALVIKGNFMFNYGKVEEHAFNILNTEIKFEQLIYKIFGLGIGVGKETRWGYNGYYFLLYSTYTLKRRKNFFINANFGAEYGVPSPVYDNYSADYRNGKLISQKWIYLIQNIGLPGDKVHGKTGILYPFGTVSYGKIFWKKIVAEVGVKLLMMKFGIKSANFESKEEKEKRIWMPRVGFFIQLGYKF